ncbi:amino acid adenylation domain-containing protein [Micromonospora sp. NPDC049051]|uniref:amino acid adenylation domain-containing protein n=1 Tax=Micromonospora sp. NPDC049051 TaxID=3364264 RepID=UPI0037108380
MHNSSRRRRLLQELLNAEGLTSPDRIRPRDASAGNDLPPSFAQERLWLMDQLTGGSAAYNIPHAVRFRGVLRVEALEWALASVVERHEVLRTCYPVVDGRVVQRVVGAGFRLGVRDVSGEVGAGEWLADWLAREALEPFDLASGPVVRGELVRLAVDDHVLLLTVHHIASDGWSSGVLVGEVLALYEAFGVAGVGEVLAPLAVQYGDFAVWQREWLRGDVVAGQLAYWRERLAGVSVLELPTDRVRPVVLSGAGQTRRFVVPGELRERLVGFAASQGVTLFMVLVAGFKVVLSRLTGQTDIAIGTQIANRNRPELEPLIGFFVNTLVLRTDLSGAETFRTVLERVRQTALGAYAHQDLPFERVVQELQPTRDLGQAVPLFNVDCMLQNAPYPRRQLPGLDVEILDRHTWTAKSDLGLMFWETGTESEPELIGWYEYSTELFDDATVGRYVDHLLRVLDIAIREPDRPLSTVQLLSPEEIATQLTRWNSEPVAPAAERTALDLFDLAVGRRGDEPAVVVGEVELGYRELDRRANRLANALVAAGAGPERQVAVYADRGPEAFVAIMGVLKAGAAFALLDPHDPPARIATVLGEVRPVAVVRATASPLAGLVDGVEVLDVPGPAEGDATPPATRPRGDHLAYVMFTSGSTGVPKGAMVEHSGLLNLTEWLSGTVYRNATGAARRGCFNADFTSDAFIEDLCLLLMGETMFLPDAMTRRDPQLLVDLLHERRVQLFQCSPTQVNQLMASGLFDAGCALETLIVAGEQIDEDLWHRLAGQSRVAVWNVYGPTECAVDATYARILPDATPSIGRPVWNTTIRILDADGNLVPAGVRGEICIGGVAVGRGYLRRPRQTADVFVPDPYATTPGARLYRTGDIGAYRPDGTIAFHGRRDDQVKIRGFRVELGEIEGVLRDLAEVADARVDLIPGPTGEDRLVAYVVPRPEAIARTDAAAELVALWRDVFDVEQAAPALDVTLDTAGWNDSASFQPIPEAEMREYRDATVRRIRDLGPRRMLEVGSGTGLILFGLAEVLDSYVGVDFSPVTVAKLQEVVTAAPPPCEVRVLQAEARELEKLGAETYDTAVFNSVVQYFPHLGYLRDVLVDVLDRLDPTGTVFLGDLRSPQLLALTHIWIEASRLDDQASVGTLAARVRGAIARERELLVPTEFLTDLRAQVPTVAWVEHRVHGGSGQNEMVRFRHDALLYRGEPDARVVPLWRDWTPGVTVADIADLLGQAAESDVPGWRAVGNARLWRERALADAIGADAPHRLVTEVLAEAERDVLGRGLDPEQLASLGRELGREVRITWTPGEVGGQYDVVFLPAALSGQRVEVRYEAPAAVAEPEAASPDFTHSRQQFYLRLRDEAGRRLPTHMVPGAIVVLDRLPINAAGKLDRRALPDPDLDRPVADRHDEPPRTPAERALAEVWQRLLGVPAVAATDNFFVLGGHSLLATSMINSINEQFGVELSIRHAFESPVLRELAALVDQAAAGDATTIPLLPVLRDEFLPLSFTQERLWLAEKLGQQAGVYNIPHAVRFRGVLRVEALEWALASVVERHEVLRTCYPVVDGRVVQRVVGAGFRLGVRDVSGEVGAGEWLADWLAREALEPFDLASGPVVRGELVRLAVDDHVLLLTVHHIASDGWSSGVLVGEVLALYEAFGVAGVGEVLAPLAVQYGDFAVWQREWLRGDVVAGQLAYWRERLAGVSVLELPTDRVRPVVLSGAGQTRRFVVPGELRERLVGFAASQGVTLFMVLVAGFKVVLSRLTGQTDIAIGTAVSGRTRPEIEPMIGSFINTLVLRTDLSGELTFRTVLERVRQTALGAYAHQDLPFERVAQELRQSTDGRHDGLPSIDVFFQFDDTAPRLPQLPGLEVSPYPVQKRTAKFPLAVTIASEPDGGLSGSVEYLVDLLDAEDVDRVVRALLTTLDAAVQAPYQRLDVAAGAKEENR